MSLDVWLEGEKSQKPCRCSNCGNEHTFEYAEILYEANITHNLNIMAEKAGIYKHLWRPEELGITKAKELIIPLADGLKELELKPEYFRQFNAENGWGIYENLAQFVREYLDACKKSPDATLRISR